MFVKLKNIICHPSRIGMYILDHAGSIFGYFFFFFLVTTVLFAARDMSKKIFNGNITNSIVDALVSVDELKDTTYKEEKLSGNKKVIESDGILIYFNDSAHQNNNHPMGLVLVFGQSEANAYYSTLHLGKVKYHDISVKEFSFEKIKNHDVLERLQFETLINILLNESDWNYRAIFFWNDFFSMLVFYGINYILCYIFAIFMNNLIEPRFRKKLVTYDSLIYFFFLWLAILYSINWLLYVGMFFSLVYTGLTFSHIKLIVKKGE